MNLAGKTVRGQPFGHRISVEECSVDAFGLAAQYAMEADSIRSHGDFSSENAYQKPFASGRSAGTEIDTLDAPGPNSSVAYQDPSRRCIGLTRRPSSLRR